MVNLVEEFLSNPNGKIMSVFEYEEGTFFIKWEFIQMGVILEKNGKPFSF
jgi:hypothetical protein